ncbi:MAG: CDP-alcohol phosphatidyltransferase family protein [Chitinophagales bacterium]
MKLIRNLPNILTLFNLFLGCMAVVYMFNDHMIIVETQSDMLIDMGEIQLASYCIFLAAFIDFFDGFIARALRVESALGAQLDSLADMVTFGFVPGLILFELLAKSYYASYAAFDYPTLFYAIGFVLTICAAIRLGKFNIDTRQKTTFHGMPTPAMAIFVAALPLIILRDEAGLETALNNKWILMAVIILLSYFMVSDIPMLSFKVQSLKFDQNQWLFGLLLLVIVILIFTLFIAHTIFLCIPIIIIAYILLSITKNIVEHGI